MDKYENIVTKNDDDVNSMETAARPTARRRTQQQRGHRAKLKKVLHSHKVHIAIVVLVIFDCILVITELIIDLQCHVSEKFHTVSEVMHYMSLTILAIFMVEIVLKVYAHGFEFFHHWLEVLDAIIITVSFVLDIINHHAQTIITGLGLIVLLRLWRITRIVHGIVVSVKAQTEFEMEKQVEARKAAEREVEEYRKYCVILEATNEKLRTVLRKHKIPEPATPKSPPPRPRPMYTESELSVMDRENETKPEK